MNTRRSIKVMLIVFCAMFVLLSAYLIYVVDIYGTRWFTNPYNTRLQAQKTNVTAGDILDRNGVKLAGTNSDGERTYHEKSATRKATAHVTGDNYGQTFGADAFFSQYLLGFDQSITERIGQSVSGMQRYGSNVRLTVDAELTKATYEALGKYKGAIVVMNYRTGEILVSTSSPSFDPEKMDDYLAGDVQWDESVLINRVTMGRYTPGSTFKIVTTVAALRYLPNIQERVFHCDGPLVFDKKTGAFLENVHFTAEETANGLSGEDAERYQILRDYNSSYHGEITLETAFAKSCNHVFAQLAMEIGSARLQRVARSLGVNEEFLFDDIVAYASSFEQGGTQLDTAWSGIGQYKDLMTPLHMCMLTAAIANDGVMMEPKLLYSVEKKDGTVSQRLKSKVHSQPLQKNEAAVLRQYMLSCVKNGTGKNAAVSGYQVGGKTGTAEISSSEDTRPNAWFTGFIYDGAHPLAICVVLEQGGSGGSNAAPVANAVLKKALALGY